MAGNNDLTTLPEEVWPEIDELPGELAQFARDIEEIAPGLGVRMVLHLEQKYKSSPVYFHTLKGFREKVRNKWIIERYDNGEKVVDIARDPKISLSTKQVRNILGKVPGEDRQLKLF